VQQRLIRQLAGHYRLDQGRAANADAGVVAPLGADLRRFSIAGDRIDGHQD
jgi:hypothetical protein|tara:strand:+ start:3394 stop:3546 length:153 start_codon:yes stop_codon:yes gene_type:complete